MYSVGRSIAELKKNILAWLIIPLVYLTWCLFTISYQNSLFNWMAMLTGCISVVIWGYIAKNRSSNEDDLTGEIRNTALALIVTAVILGVALFKENNIGQSKYLYIILFLLVGVNIRILVTLKVKNRLSINIEQSKRYLGIAGIIIINTLLAFDIGALQPKWDGLLYYDAVNKASMMSVSSVALYGHIAISSGIIYRLFVLLLGDVAVGMLVANIAMMNLSIIAVYGLLKEIVPDRKELEYVVAVACYSFSPFILGMSGYFSTDWISVCSVAVLVYYIVKKRWIGVTVWACIYTLSKEPAVISYAGICVGLVSADVLREESLWLGIKKTMRRAHYYFMTIPYFIWYGTYKIMGQWNAGSGGVEFDLGYVFEKIKVFFILNFNWILCLVSGAFFIYVIKNKKIGSFSRWLFPMVLSNGFLLIFNFLFKTINHARYIDGFISIQLIISIIGFLVMFRLRSEVVSCVIVATLSLFSCYKTIDPVSIYAFSGCKTGEMRLLSTAESIGGDSSIYNKQMLWMEKPYGEAITDALLQNSEIVLLTWDKSVYLSDGMSEIIHMDDGYCRDIQYIDINRRMRVPYAYKEKAGSVEIEVLHVNEGFPLDKMQLTNEKLSVIYFKDISQYQLPEKWIITDSEEYSYRGWSVVRDTIERQD